MGPRARAGAALRGSFLERMRVCSGRRGAVPHGAAAQIETRGRKQGPRLRRVFRRAGHSHRGACPTIDRQASPARRRAFAGGQDEAHHGVQVAPHRQTIAQASGQRLGLGPRPKPRPRHGRGFIGACRQERLVDGRRVERESIPARRIDLRRGERAAGRAGQHENEEPEERGRWERAAHQNELLSSSRALYVAARPGIEAPFQVSESCMRSRIVHSDRRS